MAVAKKWRNYSIHTKSKSKATISWLWQWTKNK